MAPHAKGAYLICHTPIESSNVPSQSNTTPISLASMTHPSLAFAFSQA